MSWYPIIIQRTKCLRSGQSSNINRKWKHQPLTWFQIILKDQLINHNKIESNLSLRQRSTVHLSLLNRCMFLNQRCPWLVEISLSLLARANYIWLIEISLIPVDQKQVKKKRDFSQMKSFLNITISYPSILLSIWATIFLWLILNPSSSVQLIWNHQSSPSVMVLISSWLEQHLIRHLIWLHRTSTMWCFY